MPYNLLLQKTAREALGIDLSNQIVVVDEAHSKCHAYSGVWYTNLLVRLDSYFTFIVERPRDILHIDVLFEPGHDIL